MKNTLGLCRVLLAMPLNGASLGAILAFSAALLNVGSCLSATSAPTRAAACDAAAHSWTVCIDPGHPSEVGRGTRGRHITEIMAAWDVALEVKAMLEEQGIRVVLTKQRPDQFVRNRRRAEIANAAHADLMVRLHCDANSGSGAATYYPDRQGVSGGVRGPTPEVIAASDLAAHWFHRAMMQDLVGKLHDRGVHPDIETAVGSHQGALTGSIYSQVPVLLVEMCVLTNRYDDQFMASRKGQLEVARAITDGIRMALVKGQRTG